jgi:hypothetical protein
MMKMTLTAEQRHALLQQQLELVPAMMLAPSNTASAFRSRVIVVLRKVMGEESPHVSLAYIVSITPTTVKRGVAELRKILEAALLEVEIECSSAAAPADVSWVHPQLWSHVDTLVSASEWEQVVREACIFFEDWVRNRANLPTSLIGAPLMGEAFKSGGPLELGLGQVSTEGQGWGLLSKGVAMAIRNPAGHRIDQRADARGYAMGTLGVITLLMSQVELEHPLIV